jgi:hypothetical protein
LVIAVEGQFLNVPQQELPVVPQVSQGSRAGVLVRAEFKQDSVAQDGRLRHEERVGRLAELLPVNLQLFPFSVEDADYGVEAGALRIHHTCSQDEH